MEKNEKNQICWQAVPCKYDDYEPDPDEQYCSDVFGRLSDFESPHRLYRRFHRNFCKALIISNLINYEVFNTEESDFYRLLNQVKEISKQFTIDGIARHNSLILLVGAVETFLKDSFIMILEEVYPEKMGRKTSQQIVRRYIFQNLDSITKAYTWLCPEFDKHTIYLDTHPDDFDKEIDLYPRLKEMLRRRHKIVHESYFYQDLDYNRLMYYAFLCNMWADKFDYFFEDEGYYKKIDVYMERPEIRYKNINCPKCGSVDCIPIIYKLPSEENRSAVMKAVINGKLKFSENSKQENKPEWSCKECSHEWKYQN